MAVFLIKIIHHENIFLWLLENYQNSMEKKNNIFYDEKLWVKFSAEDVLKYFSLKKKKKKKKMKKQNKQKQQILTFHAKCLQER